MEQDKNIWILPVVVGELKSQERLERESNEAWAQAAAGMTGQDQEHMEEKGAVIVPARIDLDDVNDYWTTYNLDPMGDGSQTAPITHLYGKNVSDFEKEDGAVSIYGVTSDEIDKLKGISPGHRTRMRQVFNGIIERRRQHRAYQDGEHEDPEEDEEQIKG